MWTGFNMVVLLAALHSLPSEVIEAAELDNCGWWGKLVHVIVPMIRPTRAQPPRALLRRQDEDLRPGLDHDQGRAALGDRDGLDLRLQARLRVEHLRPRLPVGGGLGLVRDRARLGADAELGCSASARSSSTDDGAALRRSRPAARAALGAVRLHACSPPGPFFWVATMSLRTTSEIMRATTTRCPATLHWDKFPDAWFNSNYSVYFPNSLLVVVSAVAILTWSARWRRTASRATASG